MFHPIAVISTVSRTNSKWTLTAFFFRVLSIHFVSGCVSWMVWQSESNQDLDAFGRCFL